jgi:hypothetical protein
MPHSIPILTQNLQGELVGELVLPGLRQELELVVESDHAQPFPFQAQAIHVLLSEWSTLLPLVERALLAYYVDTEQGATESGPAIDASSSLWDYASLYRARVLSHQEAGLGVVQLTGGCSWEEEHGLEVDIVGVNLVYLGQHNCLGYRASTRDKPWNFASLVTQKAVLGE